MLGLIRVVPPQAVSEAAFSCSQHAASGNTGVVKKQVER